MSECNKRGNYTPDDFKELWQSMDENNRSSLNNDFEYIIEKAIYKIDHDTKSSSHNNLSSLQSEIITKIVNKGFNEEEDENKAELFYQMSRDDPVKVIKKFIKNLNITEDIDEKIWKAVRELIDKKIFAKVKDMAVVNTIKDMGYEEKPGGMWAWGDNWETTYRTAMLGAKIGSPVGPHSAFYDDNLLERYRGGTVSGKGYLDLLRDKDINIAEFRRGIERVNEEYLRKMTPEMRRMLYLRGLI